MLETRGVDASGITYGNWDSGAGYIKNCVRGSKLFDHEGSKHYLVEIEKAQIVLMHCRAQTQGSAKNQDNNHPVFQRDGRYILVHNGQIRNDDDLFHKNCDLKLKREAEVDTEALVALLDTQEDPEEAVKTLRFIVGSYAIAAMPRDKIDHVLFSRRQSPLVLSYDARADTLYFGSTVTSIVPYYRSCEKAAERGIEQSRLAFPWEIDENSALIVTRKGVTTRTTYVPDMKYHVNRYAGRNTWFGTEDSDYGDAAWERPHMTGYGTTLGPRRVDVHLDPIFPLPIVTFQDKAAGRIDGDRVAVGLATGFVGLPSPGTQLSMRTLPNMAFPKLAESDNGITIRCPACWRRVRAMEMQQKTYTCPKCSTTMDKPKVFREISEFERRVQHFNE